MFCRSQGDYFETKKCGLMAVTFLTKNNYFNGYTPCSGAVSTLKSWWMKKINACMQAFISRGSRSSNCCHINDKTVFHLHFFYSLINGCRQLYSAWVSIC
jgi:hypothetical protein